jgi:hypothetical protein
MVENQGNSINSGFPIGRIFPTLMNLQQPEEALQGNVLGSSVHVHFQAPILQQIASAPGGQSIIQLTEEALQGMRQTVQGLRNAATYARDTSGAHASHAQIFGAYLQYADSLSNCVGLVAPHATAGAKVHQGNSTGGRNHAQQLRIKCLETYQMWQDEAAQFRSARPSAKKSEVARHVARKFRTSYNTVRQHIV